MLAWELTKMTATFHGNHQAFVVRRRATENLTIDTSNVQEAALPPKSHNTCGDFIAMPIPHGSPARVDGIGAASHFSIGLIGAASSIVRSDVREVWSRFRLRLQHCVYTASK